MVRQSSLNAEPFIDKLATQAKETVMQCRFCGQDMEEPCEDTIQLSERVIRGIGRCQTAMKQQQMTYEHNTQDGLPAVDDEKGWYA